MTHVFTQTTPMLEPLPFANISRPSSDNFFPFGKSSGLGSRSNTPRDIKREGRNMTPSGKLFKIIMLNTY